jgi:hypothetical protein
MATAIAGKPEADRGNVETEFGGEDAQSPVKNFLEWLVLPVMRLREMASAVGTHADTSIQPDLNIICFIEFSLSVDAGRGYAYACSSSCRKLPR